MNNTTHENKPNENINDNIEMRSNKDNESLELNANSNKNSKIKMRGNIASISIQSNNDIIDTNVSDERYGNSTQINDMNEVNKQVNNKTEMRSNILYDNREQTSVSEQKDSETNDKETMRSNMCQIKSMEMILIFT